MKRLSKKEIHKKVEAFKLPLKMEIEALSKFFKDIKSCQRDIN